MQSFVGNPERMRLLGRPGCGWKIKLKCETADAVKITVFGDIMPCSFSVGMNGLEKGAGQSLGHPEN